MPLQVDEGGGELLRRCASGHRRHRRRRHVGDRADRARGTDRLLVALADEGSTWRRGVRRRRPPARRARQAGRPRRRPARRHRRRRRCRTSDPAVYAIGECAASRAAATASSRPATRWPRWSPTGSSAATREFTGADPSTKLKLLGVDVASFGDALAATPGALEVTVNDPVARSYAKLVVSDDAQTLLGGVLVGDASRYGVLRPLVGSPLPGDPVTMITPAGAGDGPARRARCPATRRSAPATT